MDLKKVKEINIAEFDLSQAELTPCSQCGKSQQRAIVMGGCYYIQCPCNNHSPYAFMGRRLPIAVEQWELGNGPLANNKPRYTKDKMKANSRLRARKSAEKKKESQNEDY